MQIPRSHSFIICLCFGAAAFSFLDIHVVCENFASAFLSAQMTVSSAQMTALTASNYTKNENQPLDERPIVFLHAGPHKTGTTTIQNSFDENPALQRDHYMFLGMRNPIQRDTYRVRQSLSQFRRTGTMTFFNNLNTVMNNGTDNIIISTEDFSLMLQAVNKRGVGFFDLLEANLRTRQVQVHVAVGYRRYYEWLISLYNQRHRDKRHSQSFPQWFRQARHTLIGHGNHCLNVYTRLRKHFTSVFVINMHVPGDLMTQVYCDVLPNATNTCEWYKKRIEMEAGETRHENPSIPIWPRIIIAEARRQGFTFPENVDLEQSVEMFPNKINYTLPMRCVSPREEQEILETSLEHEKAMVPEFFESPLGEEELRKGFDQVLRERKLCSVNAIRVLQDEKWLDFFNSMKQNQS